MLLQHQKTIYGCFGNYQESSHTKQKGSFVRDNDHQHNKASKNSATRHCISSLFCMTQKGQNQSAWLFATTTAVNYICILSVALSNAFDKLSIEIFCQLVNRA